LKTKSKNIIKQQTKINNKVTNNWDDWRITGQKQYLESVTLKWAKWEMPKPTWDHDHCEFCWKRFCLHDECKDAVKEGFTTLDKYHWICKECFEDFKKLFKWIVVK
jgi:hypothetical protein